MKVRFDFTEMTFVEFKAYAGDVKKAVGHIQLSRLEDNSEDPRLYVDSIEVRKTYRRHGIGKQLMEQATQKLGYIPLPKIISNTTLAHIFWGLYGVKNGVCE